MNNKKLIYKHIKFRIAVIIFITIILFGVVAIFPAISHANTSEENTPKVDASEKIYDYANLFTKDEESELLSKVKSYIKDTNMDMVIVTIAENNKNSAMVYADDFYDYNDFGIGNSKDGILFLIDMDTRELWISGTGKGVTIYNSKNINSILDDCYSYAPNEQYFDCASKFIDSAKAIYLKETTPRNLYINWSLGLLGAFLISIVVSTAFCMIQKSKHKAVRLATNADTYLDRCSIKILNSKDRFVRTHTSRTPRTTSSSGSSGRSTHIGSSGISHSGGGRRF